ncbi:hypothetical protein C1645_781198 [Glomus cerebriforme]|uniref:Uncharacterized protein n=1 Tax=Glomus cerebriforme TaxID=658196 RepID=A0A397SHN6_9GLOM|nr:hypothetical protein C1645_781198 [Glomus cerebriforme]
MVILSKMILLPTENSNYIMNYQLCFIFLFVKKIKTILLRMKMKIILYVKHFLNVAIGNLLKD